MPYDPPPDLAPLSLADIADLVAARRLPPVAEWSPEAEGDSEMRIAADGRWYHQGGEIRRPAMVRAFASLLTCDAEGQHWLVTPTQRLTIEVEDAAFMAIDMKQEKDALAFRLNTDELVIAGPDHPIVAEGDPDTPALYIGVRNGTRARLDRSTYAQLAEIAIDNVDLTVQSMGLRFALVPA
ncbi:DUF1285 domain-containing protein [Novosphingobium sp. HII-3]|uniref:DUF1285 domain-containing protein n=1 Tax=Novosphingobium sp. HII-3 TaxID=2075565 RepID=UPI000CDAC8ED|nr:DUF1285 domain-containing protein [Novosphingobium sp. HII-3]